MNLYEMGTAYQAIIAAFESGDGEADEQAIAALEMIEEEAPVKLENCAKLVRNCIAEHDALKAEAHRLNERAISAKNKAGRLKLFMRDTMQLLQLDKVQGEILNVTLRKATPTLEYDELDIPTDSPYLVPLAPKLNKKHLIDDLKGGATLSYARLSIGQRSVIIR